MGNALSKPFGDIVASVLPEVGKTLPPDMHIAGSFEGKGAWRIEFDDRFAMVTCSNLHPHQENYTLELRNNRADIIVQNSPKPFALMVRPDGLLEGPGPVVMDGTLDMGSHDETNLDGSSAHVTEYVRVTRNCAQPILSSKGVVPSATDWSTGVLKSIFNDGDSSPPTPSGLRMHGNYAAQTGFSIEFYPESVIVACGEPARAYPYQVIANGSQTAVKIEDPSHPLLLNMKSDGSLDPGSGPYLVHGRRIVGQDDNDDFKFAPLETTCNLGVLVPGAVAPAPAPAPITASNPGAPSGGTKASGPPMSTPAAPTGNAVLSIASGLPSAPNSPNALAMAIVALTHDTLANVFVKSGVQVPPGVSPRIAIL